VLVGDGDGDAVVATVTLGATDWIVVPSHGIVK
jgi:hypothetical protein